MKKLIIALYLFCGIISCQNDKERIEEGIKESASNYFELKIENISIDSVSIISIDTLTEKKSIEKKIEYKTELFWIQKSICDNRMDVVNLEADMGFDQSILDIHQEDAAKEVEKLTIISSDIKELKLAIDKSDNILFKYFISEMTLYYTTNGMFKNENIILVLTEDFKVVEPDNM